MGRGQTEVDLGKKLVIPQEIVSTALKPVLLLLLSEVQQTVYFLKLTVP